MHKILSVAALCGALFGATAHAALTPMEAGRALYRTHCMACHRVDGSGGVRFAHAVSADLRAPALERTYRHQDALIERAILHGRDEDGSSLHAPMPRWAGRLSIGQVRQIVAYLHTLRVDG